MKKIIYIPDEAMPQRFLTVYKSDYDGKEFTSKSECRIHELYHQLSNKNLIRQIDISSSQFDACLLLAGVNLKGDIDSRVLYSISLFRPSKDLVLEYLDLIGFKNCLCSGSLLLFEWYEDYGESGASKHHLVEYGKLFTLVSDFKYDVGNF